ncbi:MAG TPA: glutaredoxin family protein [Leptolyngbyaceae cyanobacterium M33_DOE_097]|uniref:Glutaredoxin family protein n=1 Tax=Oscillatoriales cyanobacterium SpSt-418 TaxID=2282169 RepID=A0A7C3PP77_9CYAN|nr:glutaredoxin family protein [Leptolyngbyaceae cyanobacterium M33_DOE_097]
MQLILYSKPGCHLCEGLQEKLEQLPNLPIELEVRDITTRDDWFQAYQYEIPVLFWVKESESSLAAPTIATEASNVPVPAETLVPIPRPSPRASIAQLEQMLQKFLNRDRPQ